MTVMQSIWVFLWAWLACDVFSPLTVSLYKRALINTIFSVATLLLIWSFL